jgi:2-phospho-L-lactate transferase/gluconeogenesis factor (CofD/UPF0052 family)
MSPAKKLTVTALAGGIGASKLLLGLYGAMDPHALTVIVNTGDDIVLHGLKISPDLDIVTYTLAGVVNPATGWGMRGETVIWRLIFIAPSCSRTAKRLHRQRNPSGTLLE